MGNFKKVLLVMFLFFVVVMNRRGQLEGFCSTHLIQSIIPIKFMAQEQSFFHYLQIETLDHLSMKLLDQRQA